MTKAETYEQAWRLGFKKENLTIRVYSRFKDYEIFRCDTTYAMYKDGKIITQKTDG